MLLSSCATKETVPNVRVVPNSSGIGVQEFHSHGPKNLLGAIDPPDVPSGTTASIQRTQPLHNTEPRYFIPASGSLQIVSIERPKDYNTQSVSFEGTISKWKHLLDIAPADAGPARKVLNDGQLPEVPSTDAGRCFAAKLRYRTYPWGRAVIFLSTYVQGNTGGPVNNDMLVLVVQGFTNDGRYAVNGHFEIRHPKLPDSMEDKHAEGKAVFDIDHEDEAAEKWLDGQPDDSFTPTFQQYEVFLKSLQITARQKVF